MSNLGLLGGCDEPTIPSRTVKLLHPINARVDGYHEAQRTPKAGNDNEATNQAPPSPVHGHILTYRPRLFITVADSPEANNVEGVQ